MGIHKHTPTQTGIHQVEKGGTFVRANLKEKCQTGLGLRKALTAKKLKSCPVEIFCQCFHTILLVIMYQEMLQCAKKENS